MMEKIGEGTITIVQLHISIYSTFKSKYREEGMKEMNSRFGNLRQTMR